MTRTLSATFLFDLSATNANSGTISTPVDSIRETFSTTMATGTSDGQSDRIYTTTGTLGLSGTLDIDLSGPLTDGLGQTAIFVDITGIYVKNTESTSGINILLGGGANPLVNWIETAADRVRIQPGGAIQLFAPNTGYAVTAATGDILRLTNESAGSTCGYRVIITGRSA